MLTLMRLSGEKPSARGVNIWTITVVPSVGAGFNIRQFYGLKVAP